MREGNHGGLDEGNRAPVDRIYVGKLKEELGDDDKIHLEQFDATMAVEKHFKEKKRRDFRFITFEQGHAGQSLP